MTTGTRHASSPRPRRDTRADQVRVAGDTRSRWALGAMATIIVAALTAALVVLPATAWMNQRAELSAKKSELSVLQQANAELESDIERLGTPAGIEDAARLELGYQRQGETRVGTLETPEAPTGLPKGWPYSMVRQILAVRSNGR